MTTEPASRLPLSKHEEQQQVVGDFESSSNVKDQPELELVRRAPASSGLITAARLRGTGVLAAAGRSSGKTKSRSATIETRISALRNRLDTRA
jgi:hypothetical protein